MTEIMNKMKPKGGTVFKTLVGIIVIASFALFVSKSIFYAEPGYIYHVRTVLGSEEVVTDVGYKFYPLGR